MTIPNQQSTTKHKRRLGVGATCAVQQRRLHPKRLVQDTLINASHLDIVNNLLVTGIKDIKVNSKKQTCITFRHEKFEGKEIYCVKRWCKIISEGSPEHFFFAIDQDHTGDNGDINVTGSTSPSNDAGQNNTCLALATIRRNTDGSRAEDIALVRAMGFEVDDDNEPAPENIPEPINQTTDNVSNGNANATEFFFRNLECFKE